MEIVKKMVDPLTRDELLTFIEYLDSADPALDDPYDLFVQEYVDRYPDQDEFFAG